MKPSWFFEGYQAYYEETPGGRARKRLRYRGEYYGFRTPAEQRRAKTVCALLTVVSVALNLYDQFRPAYGGMVHWMAIPSLLSLVPMLFLLIGLGNFLPAKQKWEIRVFYAGYRRLFRAGAVYLGCLGVWFLMEVVFIARNPALRSAELGYVLILFVSLLSQTAQLVFMRRHPAAVIQGPDRG